MSRTRRNDDGQSRSAEHVEVPVLVRSAVPADSLALRRLAELDGAPPLRGEIVLAEVAGSVWAARSLLDDRAISDPFRPTARLLDLLELRARQLTGAHRVKPRAPWSRGRFGNALPRRRLRGAL